MIQKVLLAGVGLIFVAIASSFAAGYQFIEGYNVLDTNTLSTVGTNYAATSGQERDIALDARRGIIYMARGQGTVADGRGSSAGIAAVVLTNYGSSNFRDTGLIIAASGQPSLTWCQALAFDPVSDKLYVLGGPIAANPNVYSAAGGALGGAPNGGSPAATSGGLTRIFQVDSNSLVDISATNIIRSGTPRGFAVRTIGTNVMICIGMGNHVEAYMNDQPLVNTNSPWRRIWATHRAPAQNVATTRLAQSATSINGLALDDEGTCYFNIAGTSPARIWCVRRQDAAVAPNPMNLDFDDTALGGNNESWALPMIIASAGTVNSISSPQGLTFFRGDGGKGLFLSILSATASRGVARLLVDSALSFTNAHPYIAATAVDSFGSGQPATNQDSILLTMRVKATNASPQLTQPYGAPNGLLFHDVDSTTNPSYLYVEAFFIDTNKGQNIATAAIGKVALPPVPAQTNPPAITTQPVDQSWLEGGTARFTVTAVGPPPLAYQWQFNSNDIAGATSTSLTMAGVQLTNAGFYRVIVTNAYGSTNSLNAKLTVTALVRSTGMTPLWNVAPGSRSYLTSNDTQRGLSYNPNANHVLISSRAVSNAVYVLDADTGSDVYALSVPPAIVTGGTFAINVIGVADDGAVFAVNLTQNSTNTPLKIYRWQFDDPIETPGVVYSNNPSPGLGLRWGDTMDVRGSGDFTQIILGSRDTRHVALFTTTDGGFSFSSHLIDVTDATAGNFGLGLAFGVGDTFWGKGDTNSLRHVAFDLGTGTGTTLENYESDSFPRLVTAIGVDPTRNWLAGVAIENPDNLRLYVLASNSAPRLVDQELFPADNPNINATGAVDFGSDRVFALDSNNGLMALTLGTVPPAQPRLNITRNSEMIVITWDETGFSLQAAPRVTGPYTTITNAVSGYSEPTAGTGEKYFRLSN